MVACLIYVGVIRERFLFKFRMYEGFIFYLRAILKSLFQTHVLFGLPLNAFLKILEFTVNSLSKRELKIFSVSDDEITEGVSGFLSLRFLIMNVVQTLCT